MIRIQEADEELTRALEAARPRCPFSTTRYLDAMRTLGQECWMITSTSEPATACAGFLSRGRIGATFGVHSLPGLSASDPLWEEVARFADRQGVTSVALQSFGSPPDLEAPEPANGRSVSWRQEFLLDLGEPLQLRKDHRRSVRKAEKAGLEFGWRGSDALDAHHELRRVSTGRRVDRGEAGEAVDVDTERALVDSGAARVAQAFLESEVLSSILVLQAAGGAYYRSGGTSVSGRDVGASHGLLHWAACTLADEGVERFFLGGAPQGSSLGEFKRGFRAEPYPLPTVNLTTGSPIRRAAQRFFRSIAS